MGVHTPVFDHHATDETMRIAYFSNELPNDDLQGLLRRLVRQSKDKKHQFLAKFHAEATQVLHDEISRLPPDLKRLFPTFESVVDLAAATDLRKGRLSGAVDGILLCLFQLSIFIGHYEQNEDSDCNLLTGLGIGLLASAAVSVSSTLSDLATAGAEVIRIALRLGVHVADVSQNLEATDPSTESDSWAYVVPGVSPSDAQSELDTLQAREGTPEATKIFISAISATSVTVSGPPSRLKSLFRKAGFFRDRKHATPLPVFGGLCHAGHIYSEQDAKAIVGTPALDKRFGPRAPILSTSTGRPFAANDTTALFGQIILEILTKQIVWDNVVHGAAERATKMDAADFQLMVFRVSSSANEMATALSAAVPNSKPATEDIVQWLLADAKETRTPRTPLQSKIAIVGMACRMPGGATDPEKFWALLESGMDVHRRIPADRFDVDSHFDPQRKRMNASWTPYGCFIDEPGLFDAPFFNMSPREANQTDPMQRLALVTAYEALEQSGYVANRTPSTNLDRIGTWYGQASDDYREVNTAQEISTYFIPGGCRAFGPGRINYFFKFSGPSFNCDTACSSSLATIQAACTALWAGDVDTVVAGGLNVLTNSDAFAGLSNGHFLTATPNACKTWDSEADGYCRADGIGSIVLKRLEDAEADNDNVLGVVLAAATNHSANAVSITHPHAGHQADLYRQVLARAGVDPLDISFVEMHGTGTQAGDSEEMQSVSNVFAPATPRRNAKQPLHIGAVKSNVGHGEAAAGVTALVKVLLMLQKNAIPPHVGIKNSINPGFPKDLDQRGLRIAFQKTEWPRVPEKKRIAVINNFSAAGGNTALAIEEAPVRTTPEIDPRSSHVIALSAKTKVSLKGNIERLVAFLKKNEDVTLADLAYTTTARRYHHNHRIVLQSSNISELKQQLATKVEAVDSLKPIPPTGPPPVAFTFTGQGSATKSMNLELYHRSPFFHAQMKHLDTLVQCQGFPSILPSVDGSFPNDHKQSPVVTQLGLVCIQIALARYWETLGIKPDVVAGHSLGEYAALCVAGVLSPSDAIFLVGSRAQLLEECCQVGSHKMMAVKASVPEIQECVMELPYDLACINGPKETVLSGTTEQLEALVQPLTEKGFRCITLDVDFAFHSTQMDPILDRIEELAASSVHFQAPKLPVISPLLRKVIFDDKTVNAKYVQRATRETVDFLGALEKAQETSIIEKDTVWVEIGPHPVCTGFVKSTLPHSPVAVPSLRKGEDNWTTMAQSLGALHCAGLQVGWNEYHKPFESNLRLLSLPSYHWNDKNYWLQYNGDWALTKGNTFYDAEKGLQKPQSAPTQTPPSAIRTSTVQQIVESRFEGSYGIVVMQSDLMQPDFLAAAHGHNMNGCGVVTSSIHADIAYTLGEHLYKTLVPGTKHVDMDVSNLVVTKGLVAQSNTKSPQRIQVSAVAADITAGTAELQWHNVHNDGSVDEPFATAQIVYGDATQWLASWAPLTHLIEGRIEALERLALDQTANKFSHNMAYTLFANNLVDYDRKYRGMQSVVMHDFEAFADVTLTKETKGTWTVPPYFIDSVAHLAGFVMNVSDASDTKNTFCVTPGWQSMRFARPLTADGNYRSYVKMIATPEDPSVYLGDVYIMQDGIIMGMVGGIQFRRYPRALLSRFFSPPDSALAQSLAATASTTKPAPAATEPAQKPPMVGHAVAPPQAERIKAAQPTAPAAQPTAPAASASDSPADVPAAPPSSAPADDVAAAVADNPDSTAMKAIAMIAEEAGLELADLHDNAQFANLGIDSLMSLVISEKFRQDLGIAVGSSLFLEYPTIGALRGWLEEYYS